MIPRPHTIERETPYYLSGHIRRGQAHNIEHKAFKDVPDLNLGDPLERGIVSEGLVQFVIRDLEKRRDDSFQDNATFKLVLTDSLLGKHEEIRGPAPWPKTGRLIRASDSDTYTF